VGVFLAAAAFVAPALVLR